MSNPEPYFWFDMMSPVREEIYMAIRMHTPASVAEAEKATEVLIRIVNNALPATPNYGTWHPGDEISLKDPE